VQDVVEVPQTLGDAGRAFWQDVTTEYVLTPAERRLLAEVCATLDTLAALAEVVEAEGVTAEGSKGQTVTHPAVSEARQQRLALGRLVAQLALPDAEGGTIRTAGQVGAQAAAQARWRMERRGGVA
jgi:P27 family predicted phage terminase small subunit